MTATIYQSTDASAPVLTGATGSLVALLDACLVNGYGAKAAAGWTKSFSGTSKAAYRQGAGSAFYLRVQDDGPGAGTYKEARAVGYETMSDVDTGTPPFPTVAQATNGVFIRKSTTADSTARAWILAATNKVFHLFTFTGDTANVASSFTFGDVYSYKASDLYSCHISGRTTENAGFTSGESAPILTTSYGATVAGKWFVRSYTGIGGAVAAGGHSDYWIAAQPTMGLSGNTYPDPVDGGMRMTPLYIHEASATRGNVPGLWNPLHNVAFGLGDTISGVGGLAGRTFQVVSVNAVTPGQLLLETSNTWTEN